MKTYKVMVVYGTRPEAIKVAPVIKALEKSELFEVIPVVTGQHRQMLDQVNSVFDIDPALDLNIMSQGQGLNQILSRVLAGLDGVYESQAPDVVLVQGDTSTAMGAALAAFNRGIRVAHIEAGLRSGDILSPFPEEANRRVISQVATLHFPPTARAERNLLAEGHDPQTLVVTGNTVIDALLQATRAEVEISDPDLRAVMESDRKIILVTTHRRENQGRGVQQIGEAVAELAKRYPDFQFVVPMHLNPVVRDVLLPHLEAENILATEPIAYGDFAKLLTKTFLVLTDSGGIQEEAPALDIPVLVMRENTERQEGVRAGTLRLVGTERETIVAEAVRLIEDADAYAQMAQAQNPYGDGSASAQILSALHDLCAAS